LKLLLDEMYPPALAAALTANGVEAVTVSGLGMAGTPDADVFAYAVTDQRAVLTENVADFVAIAAQHSTMGAHHHGLLITLSSRFSRRPSGYGRLVTAIYAHKDDDLADRIIYLQAVAD
jgi:predicted nuclease of predicted toxin-antitoxin system